VNVTNSTINFGFCANKTDPLIQRLELTGGRTEAHPLLMKLVERGRGHELAQDYRPLDGRRGATGSSIG